MSDQQDLYGLPLERFVPARDELAKALRKEGQREQATEISSLRKPSVAAWAVNQLVRTQGREITELFEAGDALRSAQSQLLEGQGDGRSLREAVARERQAVDDLARRGRGLLSADGHELTASTLDRVTETLHAAALDDAARAQVEPGCLQRELRHVGLGDPGAGSPTASGSAGRARKPKARAGKRSGAVTEAKADGESRANAEPAKQEAKRRARHAREAEASARRAAERAESELQRAQARRDDAAAALEHAKTELAAARQRAKQAGREHRRAQQGLDTV